MNTGRLTAISLSLLAAAVVAAGQEAARVRVTVPSAELRLGAGSDNEIVMESSRGEVLHVAGSDGEWLKVDAPASADFWVYGKLIEGGKAAASVVQVRTGPGISFPAIGKIGEGQAVVNRGVSGDWMRIATPPGTYLWVTRSSVEPVTAAAEVSPAAPSPTPPAPPAVVALPAPAPLPAPMSPPSVPPTPPIVAEQAPPVAPVPAPPAPAVVPPAPAPAERADSHPTVKPVTPDAAPPTPPPAVTHVAPVARPAPPAPVVTHVAPPVHPVRPAPAVEPIASVAKPPAVTDPATAAPAAAVDMVPPAALRDLPMAPVAGQGVEVTRSGVLRAVTLMWRPLSSFRLVEYDGAGRPSTVGFVIGDEGELERAEGHNVQIVAREYWIQGQRQPVLAVSKLSVAD